MFGFNPIAKTTFAALGTIYASVVSESATYTDTDAAKVAFVGTSAETLTYSDAQTGAWNTKAYLNETVYAQDFVAPQVNYVGNIPETTTLVDTTIPIGWYRINNNDNVSWAQINDNQGTSWVPVNDNQ